MLVTAKDLREYSVRQKSPLSFPLGDLNVHTTPLPGGGSVLAHILKMNLGELFWWLVYNLNTFYLVDWRFIHP